MTYGLFNDDEVKLTISDLSGRIVQEFKWSDLKGIGKHSIDISQLSKGVYNCTIKTSKICETHKVIKTK